VRFLNRIDIPITEARGSGAGWLSQPTIPAIGGDASAEAGQLYPRIRREDAALPRAETGAVSGGHFASRSIDWSQIAADPGTDFGSSVGIAGADGHLLSVHFP